MKSYVLKEKASPMAEYPHMREANGFLFVSGVSARKPDGSVEGVALQPTGKKFRDIKLQTKAVIENIREILKAAGADLENLVEITTYLAHIEDYAAYNEVYNGYFKAETGPARTTVAVSHLPGHDLLIEMQAVAVKPAK